jgi:hypothetical protein
VSTCLRDDERASDRDERGPGAIVAITCAAPVGALLWAAIIWVLAQRPPVFWWRVALVAGGFVLMVWALSHIKVTVRSCRRPSAAPRERERPAVPLARAEGLTAPPLAGGRALHARGMGRTARGVE